MESILLPTEIEFYIDTMIPQKITNLGTKPWIEWHQRLQKLNQEALIEASSMKEEYVKESLVCFGKVKILIHEAILINIWKHKVLPKLIKLEPNPESSMIAYSILYHEAVAVSLLELVTYHSNCCDTLEDAANDLLDYASGLASQLLVVHHKEPECKETGCEEINRQRDNLAFDVGIRSLAIIRYLAEYMDRLALGVCTGLYRSNDIPVLFIEILFKKPWIRDGKQYSGGSWKDWDGEALCQPEAQIWLTLRQLLLDPLAQQHYPFTQSRKTSLMKLLQLMQPTLLDQLAPLIELKQWLCQISVSDQSTAPPKPILMETVLEIKEGILADCDGKWKTIAQDQVWIVFSGNKETLMETAKILNEAYNTELLEQFDTKTKVACSQCGKDSIQRCSRCKKTWYCSRKCQVGHWGQHKEECAAAS